MPPNQRATLLRLLGTIVAVIVGYQSLSAISAREPDAPALIWSVIPLVFAATALALFWRHRPQWLPAILTLFAAIAVQAFTLFGDSTFARTMVSAILAVLGAFVTWAYVILPLVTWKRGRWSVAALTFEPAGDESAWPPLVRQRVTALVALGFVPRLVHARAESGAAATLVFLLDPARGIVATVTHIDFNARAFLATSLSPYAEPPASRFVVVDVQPPDPLPAPPTSRVLLYPDASTATLLDRFTTVWRPFVPARNVSDAELAAKIEGVLTARERWLVQTGYLEPTDTPLEYRYTLKGAFNSVLRMLWPASSIERTRLVRNGQEALRSSTVVGKR